MRTVPFFVLSGMKSGKEPVQSIFSRDTPWIARNLS